MRGASPEDRLIVLACGVAARRRATAGEARRLAALAHPGRLLERLERHRLTALAGVRLAAVDALPESLRDPVTRRVSENRLRTLVFDGVHAAVLAALDETGVVALALKGLSLADSVYEDPGLRRYADVDLLVAREDLWRAVAAVRALGLEPAGRLTPGRLPELHVRMTARDGRRPPVELHWRIHWFDRGFSAAMLARSRVLDGRRRAAAEDELASLLLFYARDGFQGLRTAADVAAWWDARGAELDGVGLRAVGRRHPELRSALEAAGRLLEPLVGLPAGRLLDAAPLPTRARAAVRLADPTDAKADAQSSVTLVDLLLSPPSQLVASARRHLFLAAEVLEDFYALAPGARWRRTFWRLVHPPKMLARYTLALWRVRPGQRTLGVP